MMMWSRAKRPQPHGSLSPLRTYAGLVIGDNWISALKAHVNHSRHVFPYARRYVYGNLLPGILPSGRDLIRVGQQCWKEVNLDGDQDYSQFFVMLPPSICRVADVNLVQHVWQMDAGQGGKRDMPITDEHIQALVGQGIKAVQREGYVVVEIVPHSFVINDRRPTDDPVGALAETVGMKGQIVLAERSFVIDVLAALKIMGIQNRTNLVTPFGVASQHLTPVERERCVVVADIDHHYTSLSVLERGLLVQAVTLDYGSDLLRVETAAALNMLPEEMQRWAGEWDTIFACPDPDALHARKVFSAFGSGPKSLDELDAAAQPSADFLFKLLHEKLQHANLKHHASIRDIVLTGDDTLALRALRQAAARHPGLRCAWRLPDEAVEVYGTRLQMPGLSRTIAALRLDETLGRRPQPPIVTEYNKTGVDSINERVRQGASRCWRQGKELFLDAAARAVQRGLSVPARRPPSGNPPRGRFRGDVTMR